MDQQTFRGWRRPGPLPPGGVEPEQGETLDYICGHFRIFQYARGHRFSVDDLLTAWYGVHCAPRVERAADLGSGIGSVAIAVAWRLPAARIHTLEAQTDSVRLARKSIAYNGLADRVSADEGDLRRTPLFPGEAPFDLVLGSPPYFRRGTVSEPEHPQAIQARVEMRGSVADYASAAAAVLAPGGVFAFVFPVAQQERAASALRGAGLVLIRLRQVIFREGEAPLIALIAAMRRQDLPSSYAGAREREIAEEAPLLVRRRDGSFSAEYSAVRLSLGFPPWHSRDEER